MNTTTSASVTSPVVTNPRPRVAARRILSAALQGGAAAGVLNLIVYAIARAGGVPFEGRFDPSGPVGPLSVPMIFVSSLLGSLAGGGLYLLLQALTARAVAVFVGIAAVFTLVSFAGPAGIAGASLGTKLAMNLMHVVAAVVITAAIVRRARAR